MLLLMITILIILIGITLMALLLIHQLIIVSCALIGIGSSGYHLLSWEWALVLISVLAGAESVSRRHVGGI